MQIYSAVLAQWILDVTLLLSIMLLAVLFIRKSVLRRFGAKVTYQLWLLPLLWYVFSLFLNFSTDLVVPEFSLISKTIPEISNILTDSFVITPVVDDLEVVELANLRSVDFLWSLLFYIWLLGFVYSIAYHAFRALRFHSFLIRNGQSIDEDTGLDTLSISPLPENLQLWRLENLSGPALYGVYNYCLLLPENFNSKYDIEQQRAMLAHELVHYRRHDNPVNLIVLVLRTLFWFNPIFYIAFRAFRLDQELSCDAHVLEISTRKQRSAYAQALVDSASGNGYSNFRLGLSGWDNLSDLKERTAMLNSHHKTRFGQKRKIAFLLSLTLVGTIACTAITANSAAQGASANGSSSFLIAQIIPGEIFSVLSDANQEIIEAGADDLQNIPADSEYVAFVIDSSGSMTNNPSWDSVLRQLTNTLNLYPDLKGIQVVNDMGDYLLYSSHGQWIENTAQNRDEILSALKLWNPYSNSSPVEGIEKIIAELASAEKKVSIYVLGDDMQPNLDVNEAVSAVDRLNGEGVSAGKLVRIHGIAFPNIFMGPERFQETVHKYISYMLALTQRNGGTFEIVDFAWNSQFDRSSEQRSSVQSP